MPVRALIAASFAAAVVAPAFAQAPASPGFAWPTPPFAGVFGDVLQDRLELGPAGTELRGRWTTLGVDVAVAGRLEGGAFVGKAGDLACRGEFRGEVLHWSVGDFTWRLSPWVAKNPRLADLGAPEPDPERQWSIAIYVGGDNNLEKNALDDLREMQAGMPEHGVAVTVLIDRAKGYVASDPDWTDTRVLRVEPGTDGAFATLAAPGELDTADPATLGSFVAGAFRRFPAPHHAVVIWDHGGGWTGVVQDDDAPGGPKEGHLLTLGGVRAGVRAGLQQAGVLKLDLLAFDACLMSQLEVGLAVHDLADTLVASEAIVPGAGFPYDQLLPQFAATTDPVAIARALVSAYGEHTKTHEKPDSTLFAIDLRALPDVAAALEVLASAALQASDGAWPGIARALFFAENYEVRTARIADDAFASLDLVDFVQRLRGVPGLPEAAIDGLERSVARAVLAGCLGGERTLSHGLSIFGPHREKQFVAAYRETPLGAGSSWTQLLHRVHAAAAADRSELTVGGFRLLTATQQPTDTVHPFGGERVLFTASGRSIVEVRQHDLQYDAASHQWLLLRHQLVTDPLWPARWAKAAAADMIDLVMPEFRDGTNELFAELSGMTFAVGNGTVQGYATLDMTAPSMQAPIFCLARRAPADGSAPQLVQISFDRASWQGTTVRPVLRRPTGGPERDIEPEAKDTFALLLETRTDDGAPGAIFTEPIAWGEQGLRLVPEFDDPGRYRVVMEARTLQGRTTSAQLDYTVAENADLAAWPESWKDFDPSTLAGTWDQFKVSGPQQYQDLATTAEVGPDPLGNDVFRVLVKGSAGGEAYELHPRWFFCWQGLPCLRIVTELPEHRTLCWYGPARVGEKDGKPFLAMKVLNAGGVIWEWRKR